MLNSSSILFIPSQPKKRKNSNLDYSLYSLLFTKLKSTEEVNAIFTLACILISQFNGHPP